MKLIDADNLREWLNNEYGKAYDRGEEINVLNAYESVVKYVDDNEIE